ncbi:antitoxin Xre-like helix-turn-helix domain-containing protein [Mycobacteroides abscessus]|uniref:antitoxin Xre-like helix-turn-helix domain-containing protein n=1 Tax=Mycobacteroides abscessus TaxID=36809 RepID=UPI001041BF69|nr:antitoxin Xre-like helix-turn-helix domain-containing protein [Mycobacteroides abscessus]
MNDFREGGLLGKAVEACMDQYEIPAAEVGRLIGASASTLSSWRRGTLRRLPDRDQLEKLSGLVDSDYVETVVAALHDIGYLEPQEAARLFMALRSDDDEDDALIRSGRVDDGLPNLVKADPNRGNLVDGTVLYYEPREDGAYLTVNGINDEKYIVAFDQTDIGVIAERVPEAIEQFDPAADPFDLIRITRAGIEWMRSQPEEQEPSDDEHEGRV